MSQNQTKTLTEVFDEVRELYKSNPHAANEQIEEILQREIRAMAGDDPDRLKKLLQMQWNISGELRKYKDPTARMNKMVEMFWEGVGKFVNTIKQQ